MKRYVRVLFICHGNICRSPMSEFIFKDMVEKEGLSNQFQIASAATSSEEIGNPVYPPARRKLAELGISCGGKRAVQMVRMDYGHYDYLLAAENRNVINMKRIVGGDPEQKMYRLLDFSGSPRDIADPWYTGDFNIACRDIEEGCQAFLTYLRNIGQVQ